MADTTFSNGTVVEAPWLQEVNDLVHRYKPSGTGSVARPVQEKLEESISVTDFGAVGDGVTNNDAAFAAAITFATTNLRSLYIPAGTYVYSSTFNIPYGLRVYGEGEYVTRLRYTGSGDAVYFGGPGNSTIISYMVIEDLMINATSRAPTVNGINCENAVYFAISRVSVFGSGSPNAPAPADRVLYGSGVLLTRNTIIGHLNKVTTRLWDKGRYYKTLASSPSDWAAAIVDAGQGECSNNMIGFVVGDPAVGHTTGMGLSIRDITIQGNYTRGMDLSGESTTVESCYFEGNANYDVTIGGGAGNPVMCRLLNNAMSSEDIGTTPYGTFPYINKVKVYAGSFAQISRNNMSISSAIPLIRVESIAQDTAITNNRLNSTAAVSARISNASGTTITRDNYPEAATDGIGAFTRNLAAVSGSQSVTGLGFKPTTIEFFGAVDTGNERFNGGASLTNSGYVNRCLTFGGTGAATSSSDCIRAERGGAGNEQRAVLASFDADGFTLTWTKVGSPPANDLVVNFIARR